MQKLVKTRAETQLHRRERSRETENRETDIHDGRQPGMHNHIDRQTDIQTDIQTDTIEAARKLWRKLTLGIHKFGEATVERLLNQVNQKSVITSGQLNETY